MSARPRLSRPAVLLAAVATFAAVVVPSASAHAVPKAPGPPSSTARGSSRPGSASTAGIPN